MHSYQQKLTVLKLYHAVTHLVMHPRAHGQLVFRHHRRLQRGDIVRYQQKVQPKLTCSLENLGIVIKER